MAVSDPAFKPGDGQDGWARLAPGTSIFSMPGISWAAPNSDRGAIARRLLPSLVLLACLLIVAALWIGGAHDAYFALLRALGVPAFRFPFLDTHGELAVIDCHRRASTSI